MGGLVLGSHAVRGYADGGEVTEADDKAAGLKASQGESVGFLERLRMGNIDDSSSEAYKRFGAGRGKAEREMDAAIKSFDNLPTTSGAAESAPAPKKAEYTDTEFGDLEGAQKRAAEAKPAIRPAARNAMRSSASKPVAVSKADPDESEAETKRLSSVPANPANSVVRIKKSEPAARTSTFDPDRIDNFGAAPKPAPAKQPERDTTPRRGYMTGYAKGAPATEKASPSKSEILGSTRAR
jgi:hypothetical protein